MTRGEDFAFPRPAVVANQAVDSEVRHGSEGMTLREWYIGMIAAGLAANDSTQVASIPRIAAEITDAIFAQSQKGR